MHDFKRKPAPRGQPSPTTVDLLVLEWRRLRHDLVFWLASILGCLALWYGIANGAGWMRFQERAIAHAQAIAEESLAESKADAARLNALPGKEIGTFDDPRSAVGFESRFLRLHDCLEPTPLAMVAVGQSDLLPYCIRVTAGPHSFFAANHEWENPLRLLLGRFDSAFAILYVLPLFVLATSFNLLSREKEQGTLPLILSYPVALSRWLGLCFLLRVAVFVSVVLAALVVGLVAAGFDVAEHGALLRLLLYLAVTAAYLCFWFGSCFLVNARPGSSATHALTLASLWLVFVVLVPSALNLAAKSLYPVPSRVAFIDAVRQASDASARRAQALLAEFFHDHPELARGSTRRAEFGSRRLAVNKATEAAVQPILDRFRSRNESQQALIDGLGLLSPAIVFHRAANRLSGNDQSRHRLFLEAVEAHRAEMKKFFEPAFVSDAPFSAFDDVPAFHPHDESLGAVAEEASLAVLILLAPSMLLVAVGWRALRRPSLER